MDPVITIASLGDNYIYLYQYDEDKAFAVDPGESSPVLRAIKERGLKLEKILATHHHLDHIGGIVELKKRTGCEVIASDSRRISAVDRVVEDGDIIEAGRVRVRVIATPGHTRSSVCFYVEPDEQGNGGAVFTGDTLFVAGCGRIFECDAKTMWQSLNKLASLPKTTEVYCGHDYTMEDYEFALCIEPGNKVVERCLEQVADMLRQQGVTVPSTIGLEKQTNPFLRADCDEMKESLNMSNTPPEEVFAELRRRKDFF